MFCAAIYRPNMLDALYVHTYARMYVVFI